MLTSPCHPATVIRGEIQSPGVGRSPAFSGTGLLGRQHPGATPGAESPLVLSSPEENNNNNQSYIYIYIYIYTYVYSSLPARGSSGLLRARSLRGVGRWVDYGPASRARPAPPGQLPTGVGLPKPTAVGACGCCEAQVAGQTMGPRLAQGPPPGQLPTGVGGQSP